jgi:methanogenic corrinoid protein MtbC1
MSTLSDLANAVVELNRDEVVRLAGKALEEGISADRAITDGLAAGMRLTGERFARKEYFVPEVLVAGRALYAGMDVLAPHVRQAARPLGTAVLAVVEGDFHDIGKNIVKLMLGAAGIRVVDLGKNVPAARIAEAAIRERADIVGLSTLMTTTLDAVGETVTRLRESHPAPVIVGGAAVTASFAKRIGAEGTAPDAAGAVELALALLERVGA